MDGLLIAIEGLDQSGKQTQADRLATALSILSDEDPTFRQREIPEERSGEGVGGAFRGQDHLGRRVRAPKCQQGVVLRLYRAMKGKRVAGALAGEANRPIERAIYEA